MDDSFVPDGWLSQVAGRPSYRYCGGSVAAIGVSGIMAAMAEMAGGDNAFFYAKIGTARIVDLRTLELAGFFVVDTNVAMEWLAEGGLSRKANAVEVADARREQHAAIQDIAARSFRYSRFHLDPLFPDETANLVKRKWVENYCLGRRGAVLYAAQVDDVPAGFLAVLQTPGDISSAAIDLIGVAPEFQGRGIGTALVSRFVESWRHKVAKLKVGTQIANYPSVSFYERCGFRVAESAYVLHAHYRDGAIVQ